MVLRARQVAILFAVSTGIFWEFSSAQNTEGVQSVKVVHNEKGGRFGRELPLALEFIGRLGDIDADDEYLAFNIPEDLAVDGEGNYYVLDSGNHRVLKFSPDIKHLSVFGRRGQGPAEFNYPQRLDVDSDGNIVVLDRYQARIQVLNPAGKEIRTLRIDSKLHEMRLLPSGLLAVSPSLGWDYDADRIKKEGLPKLAKLIDLEGRVQVEFAEAKDFGGPQINDLGNYTLIATDKDGNIYITYTFRNEINKYAPDGKLLWSASRELNFSDAVELKGKTGGDAAAIPSEIILSNLCSAGIAADDKGRVWVVTPNRRIKQNERAGIMGGFGKGGSVAYLKIAGDKDFLETRESDIFKLEVFDSEGGLLGEIPLTHFADKVFIKKEKLFVLDRFHAGTFYRYRIVEK